MRTAESGQEGWQVTDDAAERYERYVARYILGPWAPLLVDAARLQSGERAIDVLAWWPARPPIASARPGR